MVHFSGPRFHSLSRIKRTPKGQNLYFQDVGSLGESDSVWSCQPNESEDEGDVGVEWPPITITVGGTHPNSSRSVVRNTGRSEGKTEYCHSTIPK